MKTLVVSTLFDLNSNYIDRYLQPCRKLIDGYLKYTNFDILILTNSPSSLEDKVDERLHIVDYRKEYTEPILSAERFNMHIKRLAIEKGSNLGYDIIYHHDCDCHIVGWDQKSFDEVIAQPFDIYFPTLSTPRLGGLRKQFKHFQDKINLEFGDLYEDKFDLSPNAAETFIIFKNNSKLKKFLEFWNKIAERNNDFLTYYCGVYFGTSSIYANMNKTHITSDNKFSTYGRIFHRGGLLDYYGQIIN